MLVFLVFLFFITPVQLILEWDHTLTFHARLWGIPLSRQMTLPPSGHEPSHQQIMRIIGTVLRTDKARKLLCRHVHLVRLQALFSLGLNDAAHTALFTGFARMLADFLPQQADIRIRPDFLHPTRIQVRCILFFHLGTIIIAAVMVLWAYLAETREHPAIHPKEA